MILFNLDELSHASSEHEGKLFVSHNCGLRILYVIIRILSGSIGFFRMRLWVARLFLVVSRCNVDFWGPFLWSAFLLTLFKKKRGGGFEKGCDIGVFDKGVWGGGGANNSVTHFQFFFE